MVASIPPKHSPSPALRRAHELVAATLLEEQPSTERRRKTASRSSGGSTDRDEVASPAPLRKWKAWVFSAWVAVLATAFLIYLLHAL